MYIVIVLQLHSPPVCPVLTPPSLMSPVIKQHATTVPHVIQVRILCSGNKHWATLLYQLLFNEIQQALHLASDTKWHVFSLGLGLKVKLSCRPSSDTVCGTLEGFYCLDPTKEGCRAAQRHSSCDHGQYIRHTAWSSCHYWH